ncbi:MAG: hypothetical protein SF162_02830 [bacterium]|nr:hypothetical protein [bacterium]
MANVVISALKTFALPRSANTFITRYTFRIIRRLFNVRMRAATSYEARDRIMAMYAPIALFTLPLVWIAGVVMGYTFMFYAIGLSVYDAFKTSGSSMLTLGFALADTTPALILEFSEAALGMLLVALLVSYLPTMYAAFSKRESAISLLEVRAGSPPSPATMLIRLHQIRGLDEFTTLAVQWELWFAELEESHTSLAALVFFRSPKGQNSWITAAGTMLDAGALVQAIIDHPPDPRVSLMIRAGFIALRSIADFFGIPHDSNPRPDDPISISREEFNQVFEELRDAGLPVKTDQDQAWRDYAGWRVNYDRVLLVLAELTVAPYAMWISDRGISLPLLARKNGN